MEEGQPVLPGMLAFSTLTEAGYLTSAHQWLHVERRDIEKFSHKGGIDRKAVFISFEDHWYACRGAVARFPLSAAGQPSHAAIFHPGDQAAIRGSATVTLRAASSYGPDSTRV